MSPEDSEKRSWKETFDSWKNPKAIAMLFLGFSAGIPILLIFSTLSVWLREAGVARSAVTFFSWAALGYGFKFLWAPLIDMLPLPVLTKRLGRRRAWILMAQFMIIVSILWMASVNPADNLQNLTFMAIAAVMLGFSSATQDIVIDAYRIESAEKELQALLASMYIAGYRIGMLAAGAGSLFIADLLGTDTGHYDYSAWRMTYYAMAAVMSIGVVTTFVIREPQIVKNFRQYDYKASDYGGFIALFLLAMAAFALAFFYSGPLFVWLDNHVPSVSLFTGNMGGFLHELLRFALAVSAAIIVARTIVFTGIVDQNMVQQTYWAPIKEFFSRYSLNSAILLLVLIGFYRVSDIVLGVVSNVFYVDMGFSKSVIAGVTKSFGLGMTLIGGFVGGVLTMRYGVNKILFLGALLSSLTNLLFMLLATLGSNISMLTVVIGADNLSAGIATTAFVAFLSSLTNISFTAMQYAIFSSLMILLPKLIGGYSGTMVSAFGYEKFFLITAIIGVPVLFLVYLSRNLVQKDQ